MLFVAHDILTSMLTFKQQLIMTILDKGLIALIVAVAGLWLNRYLEAFKNRQALENELRKTRDQKGWNGCKLSCLNSIGRLPALADG